MITRCRLVAWVVSIFFFKQKTAYEMRISDWSSDVCSSDLVAELDDPESFLETDRGAAFVKSIVSDLYYERYERHRSDGPMPHKDANELAEAILDARREDESAHRAIDRKSTRLNSSH